MNNSLKTTDYVEKTTKDSGLINPQHESRLNYIKLIANEVNKFPNHRVNTHYLMTLGYYKSDIQEAVNKGFLKVTEDK